MEYRLPDDANEAVRFIEKSEPVLEWSTPLDPDSFGPFPKTIEFHEGRISELIQHDDGVLVRLDNGREYIISFKL